MGKGHALPESQDTALPGPEHPDGAPKNMAGAQGQMETCLWG